MKIVIIGSQGFIGSHAYSFFSSIGETWGADVMNSFAQENFILLEKSESDFSSIFRKTDFDICINASGNGNVSKSVEDPFFDYQLNVYNTLKILEGIRLHNISCKFVNLSSAAVYGNPVKLPVKETDELAPISPYGWHKLSAEKLCVEYFKLFGIRSVSLRIFSVYGEHLRKQLFWDIHQRSLTTKNIQLFGTGDETRDFIYIDDLIKAFACVCKNSAFEAEVLNVAFGSETSIKKAATLFSLEIDENISITFNGICKPGDPLKWSADITQLLKIGFIPSTSFENGIKRVAKWIRESRL